MGLKIWDKHKAEKKLKEDKEKMKHIKDETATLNKLIGTKYGMIGKIIVTNEIIIENEEVKNLQTDIIKLQTRIQDLQMKKIETDKSVQLVEERLLNLDGKTACPKCGQIYDIKIDVMYCSKCGSVIKNFK